SGTTSEATWESSRREYRTSEHWEGGLRELYAARREGTVPRPPVTLAQQQQVVQKLTVNRTENVTVNQRINITNVQNVSVVAPLKKKEDLRVTGLASLARPSDARGQPPPKEAGKVIKFQAVSAEARAHETHAV